MAINVITVFSESINRTNMQGLSDMGNVSATEHDIHKSKRS